MSDEIRASIERIKKLLPSISEQKEKKKQYDLIRQNHYDKFPLALNMKYESMYNCKFENSWSELYDQLIHIRELYHIQWQYEVSHIHLFNKYGTYI